jgi:hypothetical protein
MKIKLTSDISVNGITIPSGAKLNFGNENYAIYRGKRITKNLIPGLESDDNDNDDKADTYDKSSNCDAVCQSVIDMLNDKYPDGFTAEQLATDLGETINGAVYSLSESDATCMLSLKTDDDKEIKIDLLKDVNGKFTIPGTYDSNGINEVTPGVESFLGKLVLATRIKK